MYSTIEEECQEELPIHQYPEFDLYCQRFITYAPHCPYDIRFGYDRPWFQVNRKKPSKKTGKKIPVPLRGDWLTRTVEHHLDPQTWTAQYEPDEIGNFGVPAPAPFWLGLHAPKQIRDHCLDVDSKESLLYSFKDKNDHTYPVACPNVSFYQKLKLVYDNFPHRIWCVSSRSMGLHAWKKHDLVDTAFIQTRIKAQLERIGLGSMEVHPMQGRVLRRPFGTDYTILSPDGLIEGWQSQIQYYIYDGRTPSFEQIVQQMMRLCWRYYRDSQAPYVVTGKRKSNRQSPQILSEVEAWLGTKESSLASLATLAPLAAEVYTPGNTGGVGLDLRKTRSSRVPAVLPPEARGGNWPLWLEKLAATGLTEGINAGMAFHEFAKWLWHVQEFYAPHKEERIAESMKIWILAKHNGLCQRAVDGDLEDLRRQIQNAIRLAREIDEPDSLYLFAHYRQFREQGKYRHLVNINLAAPSANLIPSIWSSLKGTLIETPLPPLIMTRIDRFIKANNRHKLNGEYTIIKVARRALNLLWQQKGSTKIQESVWQEICETKHRSSILNHKNDLVKMGFLKPGWHKSIIRGKSCSLYTMTKACKRLFEAHFREQTQETTG